MTNKISFSISYKKFSEPEKIEIPTGFHVVYGESGVGKTHFIKKNHLGPYLGHFWLFLTFFFCEFFTTFRLTFCSCY